MSIFSKLLKRGPEDGEPSPGERAEPAAPARPAPAAREPAPPARTARPSPSPSPSSSKEADGAPQPVTKAPATRSYAAPAPRPAPAASKPAAPNGVKPTPARVAAASPAAGAAASPRPAPSAAAGRAPAPATATPKAKPAETNETIEMEALPATGSLDQAFDQLLASRAPAGPAAAPAANGISTESDLRAVMATFEDLAVGHSAEVRSLMMEVRWGEAQSGWFELVRPALKSLRAMGAQVGHEGLVSALDAFGAVLEEVVRPGAPATVAPAMRDKLLAAYGPLVTVLPAAFELQGERDRREPVVVRALLAQVPGLEPLMIDKLMAAGLTRLEALFQARADEVAVVSGLPAEIAAAIVARVQAWKRATPAPLATPDRAATARELAALVEALEAQHASFEAASRGWSEGDRETKKRLRRDRDVSFAQITVVLARLGEVDLALALERQSFARRLEELGRLMTRLPRVAQPAPAPTADGQVRKVEREVQSGAHAAP
jgi:hypothetical protein